jgi:RNA polymerase sigma factor (sigma-70 family)
VNDVAIYVREMSRQEAPEEKREFVDPLTLYGLTPREQEIARQVVTGLSYKEIADVLNISPRTVETHVYRVFKKCDVANKMELGGKLFHLRTNT